jgi:DNA-directed RNA polymerase specialized sigma24 family protein
MAATEITFMVPDKLILLLKKIINESLYPPERFPYHWFPDLEAILLDLFRQNWQVNEQIRQIFADANEQKTINMISEMLSFEAILAKNPRAVLMIYLKLISRFVQRFHQKREEQSDLIQEILTRLLADKIFKIQQKYNASFNKLPSFTSYFMVCIRNIYIDVVREGKNTVRQKNMQSLSELEATPLLAEDAMNQLLLEEEFEKLRVIFQLQAANRHKIKICLKLKYHLLLSTSDVRQCFADASSLEIAILCQDFRTTKDLKMFKTVVSVFNAHETKPVKADTLRKWVENKINEIISQLNRMHRAKIYNNANFSDLIGLYFQENDNNAQYVE